MIWGIEADNYTATFKVTGIEFLHKEYDSYGVEGSEFLTHNGHEVLSIELDFAEDYDGNELKEIDYDEYEIIENIASWHLKI